MRCRDLAIRSLKDVSIRSLQHAGSRPGKSACGRQTRRVLAQRVSASTGFGAHHLHIRIAQKRVKQSNRIGSAAHARDQAIRQPVFRAHNLFARFLADHFVEVAHDLGVGMRTQDGPEQVVRIVNVGDPIAHRLVDRVLERLAAGIDANYLRTEQPHSHHVEPLALHVFRAHVHRARKAEPRRYGCGRYAVLARAGLRDHARLAHADRKQSLAKAVIDLVCARVKQVFAFQINSRAAKLRRQPLAKLQRRWPAGEIVQQSIQLCLEAAVIPCFRVRALQLFQRSHQRFRYVTAAVSAVAAASVRRFLQPLFYNRTHRILILILPLMFPFPTARMNATMRAPSFFPGLASTPLQTSSAYGLTLLLASAAFSGVNPPARKIVRPRRTRRATLQSNVFPVPPRARLSNPSSKNALALLNCSSCDVRNGLRTRIAFITGTYCATCATNSGDSSPCNWTKSSFNRRAVSITASPASFTKTPTAATPSGSRFTILLARAGEM